MLVKPKISIIIPIYNSELYLPRLFKSLLQQSFQEFEIIAINDGSTDTSLDIIQCYALQDKRINVFSQKNMGLSISRNNGLNLAKGSYICFIDSDDTIEKEMLQILYTTIINDQSDIVTTSYKTLYPDGSYTITERKITDSTVLSNPALSSHVWGQLYKKSLFLSYSISFPEGIFFEDQITTFELYYYAKKISFVSTSLYNYYIHPNSITQKISIQKIDDIFIVILYIKKFLDNEKILELHKTNIHAKLLKLINNYILKYLIKNENEKLLIYFFKKMKLSNEITKINLSKISLQYFGIYFDFITKMVLIQDIYNNNEIKLETYFPSKEVSSLKLQYTQTQELSFSYLILNYLQKNNITKIIIYGCGKIYYDIHPLLKKYSIQVIAIIDNNQLIKGTVTLKKFLQSNNHLPFLITSIAHAHEIEKTLKNNLNDPHIISARTLLAL